MGDYVKNKLQSSGGNPGGRKYTDDFRDRTPHLVDVEGNINLDREFLEGRSDMEQQMTSMGFDVGRLDLAEADYADMYRDWNKLDAMEVPDFYDPFEAESYEFERWAITDLAAGLWNRGVAGMVSGLAQAPAMLGAAITGSEEGDFWDTWIDGVNEMEEGMSIQSSDKALKPMTDGFNANNFAYAFGDGLGFIADIFLGSKGAGALLKAGSAASKIQRTQRLGTFITGTMQMQKDLYKEGIAAGLSPGNAARVAIPTAMVVSASEGAALEMLGMTISGQMLRGASRSALRGELKALGKAGGELNLANFKKLIPNTARSVGQKMKDFGKGFVKGYPVEATQEFVQTYIEDFGKYAYDTWFAGDDAVKGAGKFGVDWKETFKKALVSGLVGGMVGGTVGGGGSAIRGIQGNTTFTYVKDAIDSNKPGKVKRLINKVNRMGSTGAIKNAPEVIQSIKDMTRYAQSIKGLNIDSSTANFQLFQLNQIQDEFQTKFGKEFKTDAKTNYLIANAYRINEEKATMLTQAMNNEMQVLIQDKKPLTKDLNKFERKLSNYQKLFKKIQKGKINKEELVSEIRKNESPVVTKWRQQIEAEMEAIKQSQLDNDGVSVNQELDNLDAQKEAKKAEGKQFAYTELPGNKKASKEAINDFEKLVAEKEKVNQLAETDTEAVRKFDTKLQQQYGMSLQDFTALEENWSIGEEIGKKSKEGKLKYKEPSKTKAEQETTDKPLTEDEKRIEEFAQNFAEAKNENRIFAPDAKESEDFYKANKEAIEKRTSEIKAEKAIEDARKKELEEAAKKVEDESTYKAKSEEDYYDNLEKELAPIAKKINEKYDKQLEKLKAEKKKPETKKKEVKEEAPKNKLQELSDSIDNNKNLNERDLNAYQDELQKLAEEGVGTVEERALLNDKIVKNREQLKSLTEEKVIEFEEQAEKEAERFINDKNTKKLTIDEVIEQDKNVTELDKLLLKALAPFLKGKNIYYQDGWNFNVQNELVDDVGGYGATINGKGDILIFGKADLDVETILHEGLHSLVFSKLNQTNLNEQDQALVDEIQRLFDLAKTELGSREEYSYAFNNIDEFVSEAFGNKNFRQELSYIKDDKGLKSNVFSNFINALKKFLKSEYDFDISESALESIFAAVEHSLAKSKTDTKVESKEEVKEDLTEEMVPEGVDEETLLEEREKAKKDVEYSKLLNEENTITNKLKKVGLTGKERDGLRKRLKEIQKEKKEIEDTDKGQEQEYVAPSKE